jgi:AraC family transcriptional regulator
MSVLVKPADAPHSNRYSDHGARSFIVECTSDCGAFDALERAAPQPGLARLVVPLLELYAAFRTAAPERQVLADEVVFEIAHQQRPQPRWKTVRRPRWLSRIAEAATEGCTRPLGLTTLAAEGDVHPVYLARVFRRHYAQSIGQFMLQCRLRMAMHRIAMTTEPIARVALECGFADQSHLTRLLHRETGSTPARFRRVAHAAIRDQA